MRERTDTLTQGIRGRCGEPLFGLYRWCTGESLNGHSMRRSLLLEKGQLRDVVKSGGTQSTYISMIHRRSLPPGALSQCVCNRRRHRPVDMWTSPHPCGPARAKAVWTTHGPRRSLGATRQQRAGAAHRLPTLSGLSPTYPQALQQTVL